MSSQSGLFILVSIMAMQQFTRFLSVLLSVDNYIITANFPKHPSRLGSLHQTPKTTILEIGRGVPNALNHLLV